CSAHERLPHPSCRTHPGNRAHPEALDAVAFRGRPGIGGGHGGRGSSSLFFSPATSYVLAGDGGIPPTLRASATDFAGALDRRRRAPRPRPSSPRPSSPAPLYPLSGRRGRTGDVKDEGRTTRPP